ncbi:MAG: toll/interleukin-1 receptor domain-containing protein [Lacunisphaera sp.]
MSYASQDAEAAKRIADALRAADVEVWFDQSELVGGDAWDAKIRKQIKECALFVPLISATTNARAEGYFRLEWKLAVDRSHLLADDHPFLFPVAIGDVTDANARVPDKFREVQWTHLRLDETPAELAARISHLLSGAGGTSSRESGRPASPELGPPGKKKPDDRPLWLKHAWSIVGLAFAFYYLLFNPDHAPDQPARAQAGEAGRRGERLIRCRDEAARRTGYAIRRDCPRRAAVNPDLQRAMAIVDGWEARRSPTPWPRIW